MEGEPGEFYHVSDVTGRENLIEHATAARKLPTPFLCAHMAQITLISYS